MAIKINSDQVLAIADSIEQQNRKLTEQLEESKTIIQNLASFWEGDAYEATLEAYSSFANNYFQTYEDIINSYVKFLRDNVAAGYIETETANTSLSEAFK